MPRKITGTLQASRQDAAQAVPQTGAGEFGHFPRRQSRDERNSATTHLHTAILGEKSPRQQGPF